MTRDLNELAAVAVAAARDGEAVEAYAEESRHTDVEARKGEVEGLTSAESRGLGVRVIAGGRLGFAYVADPSDDEIVAAVERARENATLGTEDENNVLADASDYEPIEGLFFDEQAAMAADDKVSLALQVERVAVTSHPNVGKVEQCGFGDAIGRVAIASTTGVSAEFRRTGCWCVAVTLAERDGDTQTGFSFQVAHRAADLDPNGVAGEAAERAARMLGAVKPQTQRVPVLLDPFAASSFLGVLAGALSAESVQKGRSLFANLVGERVAADVFTLVDDGRLLDGPAAAPFDDEGVPAGRTDLIGAGVLNGFLHNTYTARRGSTTSTGNASRAGYRSTPGVGATNFYLQPGSMSFESLLAQADGGVLIQDVSGVHSGANPISGEFSVGATGLRIAGGALGEPVREMTIASTLPDMLKSVAAVGPDLRFFSSVGTPSILIGEMTLAGV
ncbi:MAG TPA: TldD/PmbA family protein [Actinomycetota bacterium]|jgi:PmbA protein|nr:TldD/PmbA family protein [Actinomycetota bacterium]